MVGDPGLEPFDEHAGALVVGVALLSTVLFIFVRGAQALPHLNMFVDDMSGVGPRDPFTRGGVLHAIVGTLIEVGLAVVVVLPLGIGTAVFMTEVGGRFARVVRTVVEAMTALPSIVAGLFIYTTIIVGLHVNRSGVMPGGILHAPPVDEMHRLDLLAEEERNNPGAEDGTGIGIPSQPAIKIPAVGQGEVR